MFTGIVEQLGRIDTVQAQGNGVELVIRAPAALVADLRIGDSVALDGVCQTVLWCEADAFRVAAEAETLRVTTLGTRQPGDRLNLERALPVGGRLNGHVVLGHVDGTAGVIDVRQADRTHTLRLQAPADLRPYLVPKGCVALDGVSLTLGPEVEEGCFEVYLIPYTWEHTTLCERPVGSRVNIETDVVARTVVHLLRGDAPATAAALPDGLQSWDQLARLASGRRPS
jgi:riboflavin synthase